MRAVAVCSLLILFTAFAAAAEPLPRPKGDVLAKADREVRELFADKLKAARLPADKLKLAKELLAIAEEPTLKMQNERFALCLLVRELAVAGRDKTTAFAASKLIVESYQPSGAGTADERFDAAGELWTRSEKTRDVGDRLELQAKAAELYYYALPGLCGLKQTIAEKNLTLDGGNKPTIRRVSQTRNGDLKLLIGTWEIAVKGKTGLWTFYPDGNIIALTRGEKVRFVGKWVAEKDAVSITWDRDSDAWEKFPRPINVAGMTGDSWKGKGIIRVRKIETP